MREGMDRRTASGPFEEHERYATAMQQLAAGNGDAAVEELRQLVQLYPDDGRLRELLLRTELQAAVGSTAGVPVAHRQAAPVLRTLLIVLIVITASLAVVAGLLAADERFVEGIRQRMQQEQAVTRLQQEAQRLLDAGDWDGTEAKLDELAQADPGNTWIEEARQRIDEGRALDERYLAAVNAQRGGNRSEALTAFLAIEQDYPGFRDVQERIAEIQGQETLDTEWQEAERAIEAQDWSRAIELLETIRERDPSRRALAEQRLYEVYSLLGRQEITQAGGDLDRLRQAAAYLRKALQLQPGDRDLAREKELAEDYVAGFDAQAQQDYVTALKRWEEAYRVRREYGDGRLGERLEEIYPKAALQLISEANGRTDPLEQALVYLDRAIADRPEDEQLLEERRVLQEYLAGAELFVKSYWELTVMAWGPVYEERPDYQNGALKEDLTKACALSDDPDPTYCPP
jgi:tetratricopeptide (TPR) repeat protein